MGIVVVLVVVIAALAGPAAAFGQTPAGSQYSGNLGQTAHGSGGGGVAAGGGGAQLPFTGLDLGGVAGAGAALMATGLLLRRRAQNA
jgi:hypothetical protein